MNCLVFESVHVGRQAVDDLPSQTSDERQVVFLVAPVVVFVVEERGLRRGVVTLDRRAVLVVGVHRRRIGQRAGDGVALVGVGFGVGAGEIHAEAGRQPLGDLGVEVALEVHAVVARRESHAFVVGVSQAGRVADPFAAAVDSQVVVLPPGAVIEQVLPVGVAVHDRFRGVDRVGHGPVSGGQHVRCGIVIAGREDAVGFVADTGRVGSVQVAQGVGCTRRDAQVFGDSRADDLDVFAGVQEFDFGLGVLPGPVGLERDAGSLVVTAALGGHEDDSVRSLCSVDGRRRGVFQYVDRGDVVGVDGREVAFDAVNEHERGVRAVDRRAAADLVGESAAGRKVGLRDFQTGDLAFQTFADGRNRDVLQRLSVEFGDRGGHRPARLFAVADHHDLVHGDRLGSQFYVDAALRTGDGDLLRPVADERYDQRDVAVRQVECEAAVRVRGDALGRAFDDDRGSDDGLALVVRDPARQTVGLSPDAHACEQKRQTEEASRCDAPSSVSGVETPLGSRVFHLAEIFGCMI